jgi:hypothetical protein
MNYTLDILMAYLWIMFKVFSKLNIKVLSRLHGILKLLMLY